MEVWGIGFGIDPADPIFGDFVFTFVTEFGAVDASDDFRGRGFENLEVAQGLEGELAVDLISVRREERHDLEAGAGPGVVHFSVVLHAAFEDEAAGVYFEAVVFVEVGIGGEKDFGAIGAEDVVVVVGGIAEDDVFVFDVEAEVEVVVEEAGMEGGGGRFPVGPGEDEVGEGGDRVPIGAAVGGGVLAGEGVGLHGFGES